MRQFSSLLHYLSAPQTVLNYDPKDSSHQLFHEIVFSFVHKTLPYSCVTENFKKAENFPAASYFSFVKLRIP